MLATGSCRYSCTTSSPARLPVFVTSTEAVTVPLAETVAALSRRLVTEKVV